MGGDGGSIPKRDDLVRTRGKQEQVWFLCFIPRNGYLAVSPNLQSRSCHSPFTHPTFSEEIIFEKWNNLKTAKSRRYRRPSPRHVLPIIASPPVFYPVIYCPHVLISQFSSSSSVHDLQKTTGPDNIYKRTLYELRHEITVSLQILFIFYIS